MTQSPHLENLKVIREKLRQRLKSIADLTSEVPALVHALDDLNWVITSEEAAPEKAFHHVPEGLLSRVSTLDDWLEQNVVPKSKRSTIPFISASGTTSSSDYSIHVYKVRMAYPESPDVKTWADNVDDERKKLKKKQELRKTVSERLTQINPTLGELHHNAVDATLKFIGGIQSPVEAAEAQRELLVQFKGELLRRCKSGKGSSFLRIAKNLAYEQEEIIILVKEQQEMYDALHGELAEIAKGRTKTSDTIVESLLLNLEDHIYVLMVSLDPTKSGLEGGSN